MDRLTEAGAPGRSGAGGGAAELVFDGDTVREGGERWGRRGRPCKTLVPLNCPSTPVRTVTFARI